ncbi:MAG: hypothetical protein HY513_02090 [Candidatus Aenigmarchaeota archaeon]|nr:hypothetical protein [Candidatus Aenigmarchaeota archaeon]
MNASEFIESVSGVVTVALDSMFHWEENGNSITSASYIGENTAWVIEDIRKKELASGRERSNALSNKTKLKEAVRLVASLQVMFTVPRLISTLMSRAWSLLTDAALGLK